jgi:hypothetical protein
MKLTMLTEVSAEEASKSALQLHLLQVSCQCEIVQSTG